MRDVILIMTMIGALPMIFIRPHVGVLLWGWAAIIGPNFLVYGFASSIRYNFTIAILTFIAWFISKEKIVIPLRSTIVLLLLFAAWGTISALTSISSSDVVIDEWVKFLKILGFSLVIVGLINTRQRIHSLLLIFVISLGYYGVSEGMKFLATGGAHHVWGPGFSIIGDNNHFALSLIMLLPIAYYLITYSQNKIVKFSLILAFVLTSFAVLGTYSRGGLIGLLAIGIWSVIKTKNRLPIILVGTILGIILITMAPESWFERMDTIQTATEDRSFMGRVVAWKLSVLLALDHPIFGGGFQAIQDLAVWLQYSADFHLMDFVPTRQPDTHRAHAAHSIYFQVLGDMGFIGLLIFLSILVSAWKNTNFIIKQCKDNQHQKWIYDLGKMLQISLIAYMVSGAALNMAYFDLTYAVIALTLSLRIIVESDMKDRR
ncbi:putative O-glycosylation ligase, exosortase A system-associated [Sedimenticola hydrogenitrophicus]|uniref:putative O-glycosylation ligase, exosortase A system-associated n=1 Tax=Sedimenticola hydrogenitrophicus TaxID=2967975 RepID=UPI0021A48E0D|nr:putative O-glycosylation ligase, exosortase A system-associated [Sedimenticola hydrogenitrophicus]